MPLVLGLTAHVDAGKTTLAEEMLYLGGTVGKPGRVDHGDAFLDNDPLERERGITIFSKQAEFSYGDRGVTLLDTPGHIDFSAEMERTLSVLDAAVLIVSAPDGIRSHTRSFFEHLRRANVPVFVFFNKMDILEKAGGADRKKLIGDAGKSLGRGFVDFSLEGEELADEVSLFDDRIAEKLLEGGGLDEGDLSRAIEEGLVFPCFFGSALRGEGVRELLDAVVRLAPKKSYGETFAARIFKITRDEKGSRMTHLKVTGGKLSVRDTVEYEDRFGEKISEKVSRIRIYNGAKYATADSVEAGTVCQVYGLSKTVAGAGLGGEKEFAHGSFQPVIKYRVNPKLPCDMGEFIKKMKLLEEEMPELCVEYNETTGEVYAGVSGEVMLEVLQRVIEERFGTAVTLDEGSVVYKETITAPVEGVGHFEPLRHYAEVHLILSPLPAGSGIVAESTVSEDDLARNWQRLVITHILEKEHRGVLTGSALTDVKITLAAGRNHIKHTEGGDFRQATYRAVRQGLMKAQSVLLEPYYDFRLSLPAQAAGRVLTDIEQMKGEARVEESLGDLVTITGNAPVIGLRGYKKTLMMLGAEDAVFENAGFKPCHNTGEVIETFSYDPDADLENPASSVFCAKGSAVIIPWNRVGEYMHLESVMGRKDADEEEQENEGSRRDERPSPANDPSPGTDGAHRLSYYDDKELQGIFEKTFGPAKDRQSVHKRRVGDGEVSEDRDKRPPARVKIKDPEKTYLLVDGYNIVFFSKELKELSAKDIGAARHKLMDILDNYAGYTKTNVILVFDAYKVENGPGETFRYNNIDVCYTKEAETADSYIERTSRVLAKDSDVCVATSDGLEQLIIFGEGARRITAKELFEEVERVSFQIGQNQGDQKKIGSSLSDLLKKE
ncbi:MAG: TetM/TetW/TetO/TetS family tetracycline resistance ribosomal protection protein [Lachnospiraceae bacterium]|nr:TetM/TetW/TetO/TetS family tetracycline resistance ribosomal protection protein [Lachnospiraceae bacterium]